MKKLAILLAMITLLTACGSPSAPAESSAGSNQISSDPIASSNEEPVSESSEAVQPISSEGQAQSSESTSQASISSEFSGAIPGFQSQVEEQIIQKINAERARVGLNELIYMPELQEGARIRSKELFDHDMFAHRRPDDRSWVTVLQEDVPVAYDQLAGENLCTTKYSDPACDDALSADFWFNEWVNSQSHYENMIKEGYTHIGVGVYVAERNGYTYGYACTLFAKMPS